MPSVSRAVEQRLWRNLCKAFQRLIDSVKDGTGLIDGSFRWSRSVREFINSKELNDYLLASVGNMVETVRTSSAREMKKAVLPAHNGRLLYQLISNEMNGRLGNEVYKLIADNVAFIKTMPDNWASFANKHVFEETLKGRRPEQIEEDLRKMLPKHIKTNLKLFARTESAKANAAIVQARAEMCDIKAYIWRSVADERTRKSHLMMDGVIVFYNDPPSPEALAGEKSYGKYHAGNTYNCRCYQEPIVDIRFLPNVVRVYTNGRIQTMGKNVMVKRYGKVA